LSFDGVAAKEMNDKIYVQVFFDNDVPASGVWIDSVADYVLRIIEKQNDKVKTMLVDMLNYGAAAQIQFGYDTSNLVSDCLSESQKGYATESVTAEDSRVKGENYYGSNLELGNSIVLGLFFQNVDTSMYAVVTYTDHYGNEQSVRVDGSSFEYHGGSIYRIPVKTLAVADVSQIVTCNVYNAGGTLVGSCSDSMESYIARMSSSSDLYETIMKFAVSAYSYFHN